MRIVSLLWLALPLVVGCAGKGSLSASTNVQALPNCGRESHGGFLVPPDGVEDVALSQEVRMGERRFLMRVWNVPRPAKHVRGFYGVCMKLEPTTAGEEGSYHYTKGESTLTVSGDKKGAIVRIRFAP